MTVGKHLDFYAGEGGSSMGYAAHFDVYGVDLFVDCNRKRYPFPSFKGDAILTLARLLAGEELPFTGHDGTVEWLTLSDFVGLSASPPCQHASAGTRALRSQGKEYPALIPATRYLLTRTGKPFIIENVRGADLVDPIELCGCMFDLKATDVDGIVLHLQRPRRFESNISLVAPGPHDHHDHLWVGGSYGGARRDKYEARYVRKGGYVPPIAVQRVLLGIDWMTGKGMYQSVPPAYTNYLGGQLLAWINTAAAEERAAA